MPRSHSRSKRIIYKSNSISPATITAQYATDRIVGSLCESGRKKAARIAIAAIAMKLVRVRKRMRSIDLPHAQSTICRGRFLSVFY